jgi:hypothetical protein
MRLLTPLETLRACVLFAVVVVPAAGGSHRITWYHCDWPCNKTAGHRKQGPRPTVTGHSLAPGLVYPMVRNVCA